MGAEISFVCRAHTGHLAAHIESFGFQTHLLSGNSSATGFDATAMQTNPPHWEWLGVDQGADAGQCISSLLGRRTDVLVVDHYSLDARWECMLRPHVGHIFVIDDLADRAHDCDTLLDQNLGRSANDYAGRVPQNCRLLIGPSFALLRPEFARLREASLERRSAAGLNRVMVSMGGVDQPNASGRVLDALAHSPVAAGLEVLVVMGAGAPWLSAIKAQAEHLPFKAEVRVGIDDMGAQMCASDLSIGAAGGTAWERCCLGVPTILVVLAENQQSGAMALDRAGAAYVVDTVDNIGTQLPAYLSRLEAKENLKRMQAAAASIADGRGVQRVIETLENLLA